MAINISVPLEVMIEMARQTRDAVLNVSMVTCDGDQPPNNDCSSFALLNIAPRSSAGRSAPATKIGSAACRSSTSTLRIRK